MRRFPAVVPVVILLALAAALAGCGGGSKSDNKTNVPTSISLSNQQISLNLGNIQAVAAAVLDGNGSAVSPQPTLTFTSSNPAIASVSTAGSVCAGTWDANFIVCTPGTVGTAQVTIKAAGLTSDPITVYVHQRVDSIAVTPSLVDCKSQGQTQQMTAQALSGGVDITSTVGPFTWTTNPVGTDVVNIDANTLGLLTAKNPGKISVYATLGGTNAIISSPATFVTCPVQTISVHLPSSAATSITVDAGTQTTLAVDITDTHGATLTGVPVTWNSAFPTVGSGSTPASTTGSPSTGTFSAVGAGTTSLVAACTPPGCNISLYPVFSNVFSATVNGTSATTVYAASTDGTSLIPIDTGTNTAGAAVTLPSNPNSMMFGLSGAKLFLGSSGGVMTVDTTANSVTQNTAVTGSVLAVSPDGNTLIVSDTALGQVILVDTSSSATATLDIAGATKAAFSRDSAKAYILAGNTLYVGSSSAALKTIALGGAGNDASFVSAAWFGYVAQPGVITARATCDNSLQDTVGVGGNPTLLQAVPDGTRMLAANSPAIDVLTVQSDGAGCPPSLTDTLAVRDFGQGDFTARQMFVLADSSKAYVTSDLGKLVVYDIAADSVSAVPLAGDAQAFTGGATLDSKTVYVGGSDNAVHRIDVASGTDAQQIPLSFTPNLVGVKPK